MLMLGEQIPILGISWILATKLVLVAVSGITLNLLASKAVGRHLSEEGAAKAVNRLKAYLIYSVTALVGASVLGVSFTAVASLVGLLGVGISFALKDILSNFVSGILILVSRPFQTGDEIKIKDHSGIVKDVSMRCTELRTFDGRKIIIPNSMVYSGVVENMTAYGSRRFSVVVGVSYEDDVEKATDIALETVKQCESVDSNREPDVLVKELGGSSVNLEVRAWTDPEKASVVHASSEVTEKIKTRLENEGIDIPYPIRTIYMDE